MLDWVSQAVEDGGYLGIFLLMLAENVFPPLPSEVIMPLAGFTAARGELSLALVVLSGSAGSLVGALFWYFVGQWLGAERLKRWAGTHGRWLTVRPQEIDRACGWFRNRGGWAVLIGRLVPAVRTLISVPAGIAGMTLPRFLIYTALGTVLWSGLLAVAGYYLESGYDAVAQWVEPASTVVLVLLVGFYLYRVATFRR